MAEHALLDLVAIFAVQGQAGMAVIAVLQSDDGSSRSDFRTVDREVEDLVVGAILHRGFFQSSGVDHARGAGLYADRVGAPGIGRDGMREGIRAGAIVA